MVRHEFSYWLSAEAGSAAELESADTWLHENGVVPEYLCESRTDGSENIRCYEVDPKCGTIEEWDDAPEVIGRLAESQPMLKLLLRVCDEEDHSIESLHYWHEGKHGVEYAKVISPDERSLILETEGGFQNKANKGIDGQKPVEVVIVAEREFAADVHTSDKEVVVVDVVGGDTRGPKEEIGAQIKKLEKKASNGQMSRFALTHGRKPMTTEDDGGMDYDYSGARSEV